MGEHDIATTIPLPLHNHFHLPVTVSLRARGCDAVRARVVKGDGELGSAHWSEMGMQFPGKALCQEFVKIYLVNLVLASYAK